MRRTIVAVVLTTLCSVAHAQSSDELRVLFVGNSLTYFNEMPWMLEQVAASLQTKPKLRAHFAGRSGETLRQQWNDTRTMKAIREGKYAYIVLQAQSSEIVRTPDETFEYARRLGREIKASGAKTVIFLTWAPRTQREPQAAFTKQYLRLANELHALIAPVGIVWEQVLAKGTELFDASGLHPNLAGSYLIACVFYSVFEGRSPLGATHHFDVHFAIPEFYRYSLEHERLDDATAEAIQRAAWDAVATYRDR